MPRLYTDNFEVTLTAAISGAGDTSIALPTGAGAQLASLTLSATAFLVLTITSGTNVEVVYATGRSTDTLTVTRAREGTTGLTFPIGAIVGCYLTAAALTRLERPRTVTTVTITPVQYGLADFTITEAAASTTDRVVIGLKPDEETDLDFLSEMTVLADVETNGTIAGTLYAPGPIVGTYTLSYSLE